MRRLVVLAALLVCPAVACSLGDATGHVTTTDAGATRACQEVRLIAQSNGLSPGELRDRLGQVFADAQASANPVIRARAVTLYADAASLVAGAEPGSLAADIEAMKQACVQAAA